MLQKTFKEIRFSFVLVICIALAGCASGGSKLSNGEPLGDVISSLETGKIRMSCFMSCSGTSGANAEHVRQLYARSAWKELVLSVSKVGYDDELSYYYLGRAAEELGYSDAAKTYYNISIAHEYKCAGVFNVCNGVDLPREAVSRLKNIKAPHQP